MTPVRVHYFLCHHPESSGMVLADELLDLLLHESHLRYTVPLNCIWYGVEYTGYFI